MLKLRILTAIILIPLVLLAIFYLSDVGFALMAGLLIALAAWEWAPMFGWQTPFKRAFYIVFILVASSLCLFLPAWLVLFVSGMWWLAVLALLLFITFSKQSVIIRPNMLGVAGFLVLVPCWFALLVMHAHPKLLLFFLLIVWIADTAAYFGGRFLGRHKLAPKISPNKTLEGVYCAIVFALTTVFVLQPLLLKGYGGMIGWAVWSLVTVLAVVIGDLFESFIKRLAQVKDSGSLLPGHGGILDRIDSITCAAPIFLTGVISFGLMR